MKKFLLISIAAVVIGFGARALWSVFADTQIGARIVGATLERAAGDNGDLVSLLETFLGFKGPRTFLILFLNNTELRPGGGFIGAYAVGRVTNGHLDLALVDGTEILDGAADPKKLPVPPAPLTQYLKVKKWWFRDSNWSPDFKASAEQALDFYKKENGLEADKVDGVIGFTPTVIENFLRLNGPITVDNITFTADNVAEKLEYEVEYGFAAKGIARSERKSLLRDFSIALIKQAKTKGLWKAGEYIKLATDMGRQKQILAYSPQPDEQVKLEKIGFAGRLTPGTNDYLLWADANLGALKTDWAMKRALSYELLPTSTGYVAVATMRYNHSAPVDWRTSRYISYTRVYAPLGSKIISVRQTKSGQTLDLPVDTGNELGRVWFGFPFMVAPLSESAVTVTYLTAPAVTSAIGAGGYTLSVDKELGTNNVALTIGLNFGKTLRGAAPGEAPEKFGDNRYDIKTDLSVNRMFNVSLEN